MGSDGDIEPTEEVFDELVLCVLADTAKRILGKQSGMMERWVLGNTKWSDDITVTHNVRSPLSPKADLRRISNTCTSGIPWSSHRTMLLSSWVIEISRRG